MPNPTQCGKRTVTVVAARFAPGYGEVLPTSVSGFIAWLSSGYQKVPAQFRDSATVEVDAYEHYGEVTFSIEIQYKRPETDEEAAKRHETEGNRDRALYENLKARFEK